MAWLCSAQLFAGSLGFGRFQYMMPNGIYVVRNGVPWPAVGHTTPDRDEGTNVYGLAWTANWAEVCHQDPDGDGQTNGLEMGDPECVWKPGATPARTTDISHPGYSDSKTLAVPPGPSSTSSMEHQALSLLAVNASNSNHTSPGKASAAHAAELPAGLRLLWRADGDQAVDVRGEARTEGVVGHGLPGAVLANERGRRRGAAGRSSADFLFRRL